MLDRFDRPDISIDEIRDRLLSREVAARATSVAIAVGLLMASSSGGIQGYITVSVLGIGILSAYDFLSERMSMVAGILGVNVLLNASLIISVNLMSEETVNPVQYILNYSVELLGVVAAFLFIHEAVKESFDRVSEWIEGEEEDVDEIGELREQYLNGEITEAEFERRLEKHLGEDREREAELVRE
jgi:hypothetical protein